MVKYFKAFLKKPFLTDYRFLFGLWTVLSIASWIAKLRPDRHNNYLIFKYVYYHCVNGTSLYDQYPSEYFDSNHYGPLFSLVIAPFALLPDWMGMFFWLLFLSVVLYYAIRKLPSDKRIQIFIYWFCAHELLTALFMQQFNVVTAAMIVATYSCIEKEKEGWAAFWIVLGTFVKLYGIVGLAFFFFSRHKGKFIIYILIWSAVMFVAPMIISGYDYIISQYVGWYHSLVHKNAINSDFNGSTNISLLGLVHRLSGCSTFSDLFIIVPGLALFVIPYFRFKQYKNQYFRLAYLASTLLFVILFSTGSESSTYIIAMIGVVIWYAAVPWKRNKWAVALMVFVFVLTSLSPSDIFPKNMKILVQHYALKALPCVFVWLWLIYEMCFKDYSLINADSKQNKV